jgi:hypothetical protein
MTATTKKIYNNMNKDSKIKRTKNSKNTIKNNKTLKHKSIKQFDVIDILKESKNYNEDYINPFDTFEDKYEEELKKQKIDILVRNRNLEKKTLREIHEALNTSKYNPANDFYSYINDRWIKDIKVDESQKYIVQIDNFRLTQDKIYKQLIVLVENYLQEHKNSKEPFDVSLRNFYNSFFKIKITNGDKNRMKNHIKNYLNDIDNLIHENNMCKMLAYVNELDVVKWGIPLIWSNKPDPKEPTIFRSFISGPKLTLVDLTVYFDDGTNIEYTNVIKQIFTLYFFDYIESQYFRRLS